MKFKLYSRVSLRQAITKHKLRKGDVATIVDSHLGKDGQEVGYSLEVFNALHRTIAVVAVRESQIEPLRENEVLRVRRLEPSRKGKATSSYSKRVNA